VLVRTPAAAPWLAAPMTPCCSMHNRNCEPPSELCCERCTEYHHGPHICALPGGNIPPVYVQVFISHGGADCPPCEVPDLSPNTLEEFMSERQTFEELRSAMAVAAGRHLAFQLTPAAIQTLLDGISDLADITHLYRPPTLSSVAVAAQKVEALGNNYPTIVMHPRHAARLWAEKTFEHIAPLTPDENLGLDTIVIMRTSPVSLEKTEAYEARLAAERVAATDYAELRSPEPI
jgi:hypothetical protein